MATTAIVATVVAAASNSRVREALSRLAKRSPAFLAKILEIAFTPRQYIKKLVLVSILQLVAHALAKFGRLKWRFQGLSRPSASLQNASSYAEWQQAKREFMLRSPEAPMDGALYDYCEKKDQQAEYYLQLVEDGDMHGLMFALRSELIRSQAGGSGYTRDGNVAFRKHRGALELLSRSQEKVMRALQYIATGSPTNAPSIQERLSFVHETQKAFGRTALLLSGGAAFGFKHGGVLQALNAEGLLPRIISGSSAGSIAAAAVCVCDAEEVTRRVEGGFFAHVVRTTFFGAKRGGSAAHLPSYHAYPVSKPIRVARQISGRLPESMSKARWGSVPDLTDLTGGVSAKRLAAQWRASGGTSSLDQNTLLEAILPLVGELTFLEAFDASGRVLNICVSRSDGKVDSLMCNYLTTPQMLVYSACLASCAIPGVYEPVELLAKSREGYIEPYFKTGEYRWTDGGLQSDLPKARLSELFGVNQFIVSQVNPLAPLFVPCESGLPFLTEAMTFLRHQLVGFVHGTSQIAQGRLVRPGGIRLVDVLMQEYEGSVTLFPEWRLSELSGFIANFDAKRMEAYQLDGARAVWPNVALLRSLCEIEFELDRCSTHLMAELGRLRAGPEKAMPTAGEPGMNGEDGAEALPAVQMPHISSFASLRSMGAV